MVILVTRLWDFVTDPLIGWLSDRKPRDVSGWLGTIRAPGAGNESDP